MFNMLDFLRSIIMMVSNIFVSKIFLIPIIESIVEKNNSKPFPPISRSHIVTANLKSTFCKTEMSIIIECHKTNNYDIPLHIKENCKMKRVTDICHKNLLKSLVTVVIEKIALNYVYVF